MVQCSCRGAPLASFALPPQLLPKLLFERSLLARDHLFTVYRKLLQFVFVFVFVSLVLVFDSFRGPQLVLKLLLKVHRSCRGPPLASLAPRPAASLKASFQGSLFELSIDSTHRFHS